MPASALLVILLLCRTAWSADPDDARRLLAEGRPHEALALAEAQLQAAPEDLSAHEVYIDLMLMSGQGEALYQSYAARARARGGDAVAWTLAGRAATQAVEAEQAFRAALTLQPGLPAGLVGLAQVQQATGRYSAATETWSQVLAIEPQRAEAWTGLRESWAGLGDRGQALSVARRAVQASPQDAGAWLTIAREAPAEALATLEQAARALPAHAGVLLALGAAQLQAGQLDAAAASYARGLAIDPIASRARVEAAMVAEIQAGALSQPAALQLLQIQLLSALQPAEARLKVERLSGEFPRSLQARLIWGQLLMAQGDFTAAERVLRALLVERPEAPEAAAALGLTLLSQRRHAEALPLLIQASAARPADPGLAVAAAVALAESGRRDQAMAELQALMLRFPLATGPTLALARLKVSVGDSDGAQAVLMTTLRRRPEPELALALASIAASSGQTATAIALLDGLAAATRDGRYQRAAEGLRSRMGGAVAPSSEMQQ